MAEAAKKSSKMLRAIDKCRNFANGSTSRKGGFQTSRTIKRASSGFLIHVNLARFPESVKSWRTMSTSRIGLRGQGGQMWAYALSLCSHMTTTHPNLWNYEHKPLYDYLNIHPPALAGHTNVSERE